MKQLIKTVIIIMLTFVLLPFLPEFQAEAAERNDYIKVGLKFGSSSVTSCIIKSEVGFLLGNAEDRDFIEGMPLPAFNKLIASNENGYIVLRDEAGKVLSADLGSSGCIMPGNYGTNGILYLDDIPYRDGIMLLANSNGTMTVINYITLEHYIYGVLNSELNYTNPKEALKAQAVAARSFGELSVGKHSADGFDLCTSTHCQVYKGYSGEYPATNEAVDETMGKMICYKGEPITAFYFKNSGGYTQNVEDVWGTHLPYLKSVKDKYCPSYPWSTSLSFDSIRTKLEAAGFRPGMIESVSINERNETGAVSELKITGSEATIYLKREKIRNVLGATIVKSNIFELTDSPASAGKNNWFVGNGISFCSPDSYIYVINGSGTIKRLDNENTYGTNGTSTVRLSGSKTAETVNGGTVSFSGYGYGHGVGMPQDSAVEMAKQGFTYDEILKYYYTDIEID